MTTKKSVAIVSVTSYTGLELVRLLAGHPEFEVVSVTGRSAVGKRLDEVFPQLRFGSHEGSVDPGLVITEESAQTELAFVCLPHAAAAESVGRRRSSSLARARRSCCATSTSLGPRRPPH